LRGSLTQIIKVHQNAVNKNLISPQTISLNFKKQTPV